jgi:hypothetical protein
MTWIFGVARCPIATEHGKTMHNPLMPHCAAARCLPPVSMTWKGGTVLIALSRRNAYECSNLWQKKQ